MFDKIKCVLKLSKHKKKKKMFSVSSQNKLTIREEIDKLKGKKILKTTWNKKRKLPKRSMEECYNEAQMHMRACSLPIMQVKKCSIYFLRTTNSRPGKLWIALAKAEKALGINITDEQIAELEANKENINYEVAREREKCFITM